MPPFLHDLARSARLLRRQPGLTVAAVTALAMGIGFTTTMFSIVHGGTRALPFDEPHEIVVLQPTNIRGGDAPARPFEFDAWRTSLASFEGLGAWRSASVNVSGTAAPDRIEAAAITPNTFALLGATVAAGRPLGEADARPGAPRVVVIADSIWRSRYGASATAIGDAIRLDGVPHEIVGIMPPGFGFPINARLWTPLGVEAAAPGEGEPLTVFGRLKDGVGEDRAGQELSLLTTRLAAAHPPVFRDRGARVLAFVELETPREIQRGLQILVMGVSLAFLVACANVANLLLARAAGRSRDTALRSALGASRARLIGVQLAETTLFAALGCGIGLAMASVGLRIFRLASAGILEAFWVDFRVDAAVVVFAATLGLLAALAAGLIPALRATAAGPQALLKTDAAGFGFRIGRLGRVLVVIQLALACGLLVLTATFVRASASIRAVDLVFPAERILTTMLSVPAAIVEDPAARHRYLARLDEQFDAAAATRGTAFASVLPGRGAGGWAFAFVGENAAAPRYTGVAMVTPEFFALADASARRGRLFTWQDDERALPVAVVNESFVSRFSTDRDVLDRRIRIGDRDFAVVGVVPDLLMQDPEDADGAGLYLPMLQARPYAIRTMTPAGAAPLDALPGLRAAVAAVDPDLPVIEAASLYDAIYADKQVLDAVATLFLGFGLGTIFLALIGLFAILSFTVTARTREFGVRRALGASAGDIVRLVLRRGAIELAWGLGIGLVIAVVLSRALAAALENVPPAGPDVFAAIVAVVVIGACAALWSPVRRAARASIAGALRE
jgi:predicted permease